MQIRSADDLANVESPAWSLVQEWIEGSPAPVRLLEVDPVAAREALHRLQVSAGSTLGALALNSGGMLIDHGWFKLLGAGAEGLCDIATANGLPEAKDSTRAPGQLIVGFDAVGGCFAIDGGALGVNTGEVCYFGPDSLSWGGLGGGHSDFVRAALAGSLSDAFASLRWDGWQDEVEALAPDQGISLWPPPFTTEGHDIGSVSRRAISLAELVDFYRHVASQWD